MGSVNRVILVGRLGADPELKYVTTGKAVCNLRIACTDTHKGKDGQKQERTEWVRVVVWGEQGEHCSKYLQKGSQCYVEGRLETRTFEKDGQKRYATDVIAERVVFLSEKAPGGGGIRQQPAAGRGFEPPPSDDESDPF